jgi:adenine deaminase
MNEGCMEALVKQQVQGSMMTKTSRSVPGYIKGHTSHLKSQQWTSDEHSNACVQEGLTSR